MPSKSKTDLTKMIGCEWITDLGDSVFINGSGSSCIQKNKMLKHCLTKVLYDMSYGVTPQLTQGGADICGVCIPVMS